MRQLIALFLSTAALFGFADTVRTLSADFNQTIIDDTNKTITYLGHVDAARPDRARWDYTSPVTKNVFVIGRKVTIVEPELEQAIVKTFKDEINIFDILAKAKKIAPDTFVATHASQQFTLIIKDDIPMAISYKDAFENRIRILFSRQQINSSMDNMVFKPDIPGDFDVLRE